MIHFCPVISGIERVLATEVRSSIALRRERDANIKSTAVDTVVTKWISQKIAPILLNPSLSKILESFVCVTSDC